MDKFFLLCYDFFVGMGGDNYKIWINNIVLKINIMVDIKEKDVKRFYLGNMEELYI